MKFILVSNRQIDAEGDDLNGFPEAAQALLDDKQEAVLYKRVGHYITHGVKFLKDKETK